MALFPKKHKCPKCQQTVQILHKDHSHAFFCDNCRYPLYWNSGTQTVEADTLRSKHAHKRWSDRRARQRQNASLNAAAGSSCLLPLIGIGLIAAVLDAMQ